MAIREHQFGSAERAGQKLAEAVAANLRSAIEQRGRASLVVSGGLTAIPLFHALRDAPLNWAKVVITLADERWVPVSSPDSNENLVRKHLLTGAALDAELISLKLDEPRPIQAIVEISERIQRMPRPFDAVVLGMGLDGHTASLFPNMPALQAMLNPSWAVQVGVATAPEAPTQRVTLTLRALLDARKIYLQFSGEDKVEVYEAARDGDTAFPIAGVLRQKRVPVEVFITET